MHEKHGMPLCLSGAPQDAAQDVAAVLEFISASLCWGGPEQDKTLNDRATYGLTAILYACTETLIVSDEKLREIQVQKMDIQAG